METILRKIAHPINLVLHIWDQNSTSKNSSILTKNFSIFRRQFKEKSSGDPTQSVELEKESSEASEKNLEHSYQLKQNEKFSTETFSALLDEGWGNVKISFFHDKIGTYITDKHSAYPFILINGTEKQEQWFLWKAITGKEYIGPTKQSGDSNINDSENGFARLIGLSGYNFIVQKVGKYHDLVNTNLHKNLNGGIDSGWSRVSPLPFFKKISKLRFGNDFGRPAVVYRLIFWNPDQRDVLTGNQRFVIFCYDNGTGKHKIEN